MRAIQRCAGELYRSGEAEGGAAAKGAIATVVLVIWYFTAPLDRSWTPWTAIALAVGLALLGVFVVVQVRAVVRSPHPRRHAAGVLVFSSPLLLVLFATSYLLLSQDAFSEKLTRIDALYFATTVFATVGFGDIVPLSQSARSLVLVQILVDLVYVGLLVRALYEAARIGVQRRS